MECGKRRKPFNRKVLDVSSQMTETTRKRLERQLADPEIHDALNPSFLFQQTMPDLLLAIAGGLIDPVAAARKELASRGLNQDGRFVGFGTAREIWEAQS